MGKPELISEIIKFLSDPERLTEILYILNDLEFEFFKSVLDQKEIRDDQIPFGEYHLMLGAGYINSFFHNDQIIFVIPDEIKELYKKIPAEFFKEKKHFDLIHEYAMAAIALYGIIKQDDFVELFNSQNKRRTTIDEIFSVLIKHVYVRSEYCFYKEFIVSDVFEENDFKDVRSLEKEMKSKPRYLPSKDELLKYSDSDYYEETPQIIALKGYIEKNLCDDDETVQDILDEIHDIAMDMENPQEILGVFEQYGVTFKNLKQLKECFKYITELMNNTRMWSNNGHTPNEITNIFTESTPKPNPEIPFEYSKTGRNEPCPCGSGKKYKECCELRRIH